MVVLVYVLIYLYILYSATFNWYSSHIVVSQQSKLFIARLPYRSSLLQLNTYSSQLQVDAIGEQYLKPPPKNSEDALFIRSIAMYNNTSSVSENPSPIHICAIRTPPDFTNYHLPLRRCGLSVLFITLRVLCYMYDPR